MATGDEIGLDAQRPARSRGVSIHGGIVDRDGTLIGIELVMGSVLIWHGVGVAVVRVNVIRGR